jgi:Zn ribbon nucleic-acid-binding protein
MEDFILKVKCPVCMKDYGEDIDDTLILLGDIEQNMQCLSCGYSSNNKMKEQKLRQLIRETIELEELDTPQQMMSKASSTEDRLDAIFEFQSAISDLVMTGVIKPGGVMARSLNKVFMTLEKKVKAEDRDI